MAGPERWPPLLIPELPTVWIRSGVAGAIVGAVLMAWNTLPTRCGFVHELCHPLVGSLRAPTTTVFWFWLLAPCVLIALDLVHVAKVTISWLHLDVFRPRRA